jgi:hypothetical protein
LSFHDINRPAQQCHRGFQRAEAGVRGKRHVLHFCQWIIGLERLGVEHVEPGMADLPALQRSDQRGFVHQRAARGIDEDDARLHARNALGIEEAAGLVAERQVQRHHIGARK